MRIHSVSKLLTLLIIGLIASTVEAQTWTLISEKGPTQRSSSKSAEMNGKIYVIGGLIPNTSIAEKKIDVYDLSLKTWTTLIPEGSMSPGFGGQTWSHDGKIYSFSQQSIYVYDPSVNHWEAPPIGGEQPSISVTRSPVLLGSRVYFIGADPSGEDFRIPYLELSDLTWGQLQTTGDQQAGMSPTGVSTDNSIIIFQGVATERTSDVSILDLSTNTWSRHSTGAGLHYFNTGVEHENTFLLLAHTGQEGTTLKTLALDPVDHSLKPLTVDRQISQASSFGLFNVGGVLYSIGHALDNSGQSAVPDVSVEALTFPQSVVKNTAESQINIFPNPVSRELYVRSGIAPSVVRVFNVTGQLVLRGSGISSIDASELQSGIYTLACEIDGEWTYQKFIKE
jgi:hypothetical protein